MKEISRYEKNIHLQPSIIREALKMPVSPWMPELKSRRIFFVGIGTSFHAAQLAQFMWKQHVSADAYAINSFDFVKTRQPVGSSDVVVVFSHRGTKSYSVQAAHNAHAAGALTVGITSKDSPWKESLTHRIDTCESEDTGGFTKSFTCALAHIVRWIDSPKLREDFLGANLQGPPKLPDLSFRDLVLIGDLEREWVAREIALKVQEIAYLPARAFGLEEFLHGPRVSVDERSVVVAFDNPSESRWSSAYDFLERIGAPIQRVRGTWLSQLYWGQQFALDICLNRNIDPDSLRTDDARYKEARANLVM